MWLVGFAFDIAKKTHVSEVKHSKLKKNTDFNTLPSNNTQLRLN